MNQAGPVAISDEMVNEAAAGDALQRDRLFTCLTPLVRIMVNARLHPTLAQTHLAEDLVQEVMVALAAPVPRGLFALQRRTAAGLRAFTSTIVSRRVADVLREKARGDSDTPEGRAAPDRMRSLDSTCNANESHVGPMWAMLSASGASPQSQADQLDLFQRVMAALAQLKEDHRTAITLAFFDQLETRDIAEQMGLSRPAASMLVIRAVKALRRELTGSSQMLCTGDARLTDQQRGSR